MPNPKGNVNTLQHYEGKWRHGATKTIRVPIVLADQVLEYAKKLDQSPDTSDSVVEAVKILTEALQLKPNAGGAIKTKIREAIALLQSGQT
jgi:hypothetical protein